MGTQESIVADMVESVINVEVQHYIDAALWTEHVDSDRSTTEYASAQDQGYDRDDLSAAAWRDAEQTVTDALTMVATHRPADIWPKIVADPGQFGHDLWMTRQGTGCGFWDGDWDKEVTTDADGKVRVTWGTSIGHWLTESVAHPYGSTYLYLDENNKINFGDQDPV